MTTKPTRGGTPTRVRAERINQIQDAIKQHLAQEGKITISRAMSLNQASRTLVDEAIQNLSTRGLAARGSGKGNYTAGPCLTLPDHTNTQLQQQLLSIVNTTVQTKHSHVSLAELLGLDRHEVLSGLITLFRQGHIQMTFVGNLMIVSPLNTKQQIPA